MKKWWYSQPKEGAELNGRFPNKLRAWCKALGFTRKFLFDSMVRWTNAPDYDPDKHICKRTMIALWYERRQPRRIVAWKFARFFGQYVPGRRVTPLDVFPGMTDLTTDGGKKKLTAKVGPDEGARLVELDEVLAKYQEAEAQIRARGS